MRRTQSILVILGAFWLLGETAYCVELLQPEAMQQDVALLEQVLLTVHPGSLRYNTPASLQANLQSLRAKLDQPADVGQAYLAFSEFTVTLHCGHTFLNLVNQNEKVAAALAGNRRPWPITFIWFNKKMLITGVADDGVAINVGDQIVSVNGVPTATLLQRLRGIAAYDGENSLAGDASIGKWDLNKLEPFDIFLPLIETSAGTSLSLELSAAGGTVLKSVTLDLSRNRPAQLANHDNSQSTSPWDLQFPSKDLAVLRMPTWAVYNSKFDWKQSLASSFQSVIEQHTNNLVIDLRSNAGGLDVGTEIATYLIPHELPLESHQRLVRFQKIPDSIKPYLKTWDASFYDWSDLTGSFDGRFYTVKSEANNSQVLVPKPLHFDGKVFVIVGPENSSATFQFASLIKKYHLGTLVGQPTGGNQQGINGGAFFFLNLPNTGIEIDIPILLQTEGEHPADNLATGIQPDILVSPVPELIANKVDQDMKAIRTVIGNIN